MVFDSVWWDWKGLWVWRVEGSGTIGSQNVVGETLRISVHPTKALGSYQTRVRV